MSAKSSRHHPYYRYSSSSPIVPKSHSQHCTQTTPMRRIDSGSTVPASVPLIATHIFLKTDIDMDLCVYTIHVTHNIRRKHIIPIRILLERHLDPIARRLGGTQMTPCNGQFSLAGLTV